MPKATPFQLGRMSAQLRIGPIVIGESHSQKHGRKAIKKLIDLGVVRTLSMEAPVVPEEVARGHGELDPQHHVRYFGSILEVPNAFITLKDLAAYAEAKRIPVHCHDLPARNIQTWRLAPSRQQYSQYMRQFGFSTTWDSNRHMFQVVLRNQFSAGYVGVAIRQHDPQLVGVVILVGDKHATSGGCADNPAFTIQGRLNIPEDRVYHLT